MEIKIDVILCKIICSYTKNGIIQLASEIPFGCGTHIGINFSAPWSGRGILVFTKGHFTPFKLADMPIIVIPDKVAVDVLSDILTQCVTGKVSEHVKTIRLGRREVAILKEMIFEKSDDEISNILRINKKTVSSHKDNIKKKISANSKIDIFYAFSIFSFKDYQASDINNENAPSKPRGAQMVKIAAYPRWFSGNSNTDALDRASVIN